MLSSFTLLLFLQVPLKAQITEASISDWTTCNVVPFELCHWLLYFAPNYRLRIDK